MGCDLIAPSQGLEHWKQFFANHKSYFKVGKVSHPPIDPASPIPEHCNPKKRDSANPKKETKERKPVQPDPAAAKMPGAPDRQEL